MEKLQRNERVGAMLKVLSDHPGRIFTLNYFSQIFGAAKSSISEDIDIAQGLLGKFDFGQIQTLSGASGGIRYIPTVKAEGAGRIINSLCMELSSKDRILPGGYIYMLDIIYNPVRVSEIGGIFADRFHDKDVDYVLTVETKGIPLAFMTAKYLNVPLVIVRHYNEATDGSSVNINYVSGSSKRIQTMVLSLKSIRRNSRLLFIDDFMKGGGTAKGIIELAKEFDSQLVGIGVLIETATPEKKLVGDYFSLLTLKEVDEGQETIDIVPSVKDWKL